MNDSILWLELVVGIIVSFSLLGIFIWAVKQGQFDDGEKMMNGLLFDSTEDLQDAIKKEEKIKELKKKKVKETTLIEE
ncbi:MAG: cbb3-type cytochrome oxidase assembly protein CcoS [Epsilonproteobacteria bacterium]|nr:cbb3-type cytochrome oxidase assembly protein CcoS [Campylobacterota bacterium]